MNRILEKRVRVYTRLCAAMQSRINLFAVIRFVDFVAVLALLGMLGFGWLRYVTGGLALLGSGLFVYLMVLHDRCYRFKTKCGLLLEAARNDLARRNFQFKDISYPHPIDFPDDHPFALDLDLRGNNSLLKLLDDSFHKRTKDLLRSMIEKPEGIEQPLERQRAVAELARKKGFRMRLGATTRLDSFPELKAGVLDPLLQTKTPFTLHPAAYILGRITSLLSTGALFCHFFLEWDALPWMPLLGLQIVVFYAFDQFQKPFFFAFMDKGGAVASVGRVIQTFESIRVRSPLLVKIQKDLVVDGRRAGEGLAELSKIHESLQYRSNGLLHFVVNILFMWDQHHLRRLDRWRTTHGGHMRQWITHIFEIEALAAIANFHYLYPEYPFPQLEQGSEVRIDARDMAHPCLPHTSRVGNDFSMDGSAHLFLVTGSNMSGKSTFLRTIGLNQVLARLGAPVCAGEMTTTLPVLWTSIKIQDSLAEGVSYFYAEVKRMKQILDDIARGDAPVLYLLDEILKGTNSRERLVASRALVDFLLKHHASGLITTHDLELLGLVDKHPDAITSCHFQEGLEGDEMYFDYKLKPGRLTSTNALRVMKLAGVPLDLN